MTNESIIRAPAKINLYLHVLGRRPDGYHILDSLITFVNLYDILEIEAADDLVLTIDGPFGSGLSSGEDNLIIKAANILSNASGVKKGANIKLTKNLPIASGMGAGSSDAVATFKALSKLWGLSLSSDDLCEIALDIGAELPFFITGKSAIVSSIGEYIEPIDLPKLDILLVNPGIPVLTAQIFNNFAKKADKLEKSPIKWENKYSNKNDLINFLLQTKNDLKESAIDSVPQIGAVIKELEAQEGCLFANMSGSGATCFGIFDNAKQAEEAKDAISQKYPDWWVENTTLLDNLDGF